ncbi:MAG: formylglycine-generating enzyme family protein [Cryomorphaceae bacterium]|nr:formylglycine-generating enzyme family protein [Cryomorphaceae bacterium]
MRNLLPLLFMLLIGQMLFAQTTKMARVEGGRYLPLYGSDKSVLVEVATFQMDKNQVTHEQFLAFVKKHPGWMRSEVKPLFADERYLALWENDTVVPEHLLDRPVNNVSWFAAKAYCACYGKRLPTLDEWEYAAMANEYKPDARKDSLFNAFIVRTYEKPKTYLFPVQSGYRNYWGLYDMHGLVWEWVDDFNSVIITGESRSDRSTDQGLFCAAGSVGASDLMDYAAFMRYAFRSSIKARFSLTNTGFRCAGDIEPTIQP